MAASDVSQGAGIGRGEVRQGVLLEIGPEGLHGVEFGSVGRKQDAVESAASVEELPDGSGAVSPEGGPTTSSRGLRRWVARSRRNSINQETSPKHGGEEEK